MFDFSIVTQWFDQLLQVTLGCPEWLAILIECVLVGVIILTAYALIACALIFMERKVCAYFQCRLGPMRVPSYTGTFVDNEILGDRERRVIENDTLFTIGATSIILKTKDNEEEGL